MRNVAVFLYGQVLLWCVRLIFPVDFVGDFVATHGVWVSPRSRQEVTTKRWRATPPTMGPGGGVRAVAVHPAATGEERLLMHKAVCARRSKRHRQYRCCNERTIGDPVKPRARKFQ